MSNTKTQNPATEPEMTLAQVIAPPTEATLPLAMNETAAQNRDVLEHATGPEARETESLHPRVELEELRFTTAVHGGLRLGKRLDEMMMTGDLHERMDATGRSSCAKDIEFFAEQDGTQTMLYAVVGGPMCRTMTLRAIEAAVADAVAGLIGLRPQLWLDAVTLAIEIPGLSAGVFFDAINRQRYAGKAQVVGYAGGHNGFLCLGPGPIQLDVTNLGTQEAPACRVTMRVEQNALEVESGIRTTGDFARGAGLLLNWMTQHWCRFTESEHPLAPAAPWWTAVHQACMAWAEQLPHLHGCSAQCVEDVSNQSAAHGVRPNIVGAQPKLNATTDFV